MTWGFGDCQYRVVEGWGKGPEGRRLGIVSSIATDAQDRVYVIDREPNPAIVVFDRDDRTGMLRRAERVPPIPCPGPQCIDWVA